MKIILLVLFISLTSYNIEHKVLVGRKIYSISIEKSNESKRQYDSLYEITVEYIKQHEGFAGGKPYICPGGYSTIGYGHLIRKSERFTYLSKQQADSLLRMDLNRAINSITIPLTATKRLAIGHFVYTRGIGAFNKSTLRKCILNKQPIDAQIMRYCYYKGRTGNYIYSTNSYKMRKFELELWKKKL